MIKTRPVTLERDEDVEVAIESTVYDSMCRKEPQGQCYS